jgi:hypothetical protein
MLGRVFVFVVPCVWWLGLCVASLTPVGELPLVCVCGKASLSLVTATYQ